MAWGHGGSSRADAKPGRLWSMKNVEPAAVAADKETYMNRLLEINNYGLPAVVCFILIIWSASSGSWEGLVEGGGDILELH